MIFPKVIHLPRATTRNSHFLNGDMKYFLKTMCGYQGPKIALQIRETLKSILSIAKGSPAIWKTKSERCLCRVFAEASSNELIKIARISCDTMLQIGLIADVIACWCKISDKFIIDVLSSFSIASRIPINHINTYHGMNRLFFNKLSLFMNVCYREIWV